MEKCDIFWKVSLNNFYMGKQIFYQNENLEEEIKRSFSLNSAIQIKNFISNNLCKETEKFLLENEKDIIEKYKNDKRGLVVDYVNSEPFIKYFDKPLEYNFNLFQKFLTSNLFSLSKKLIGKDVYLKGFEIHSRCALGTSIPSHQDNAYFGLKDGNSLTFYISLNPQDHNNGGLRYYKIPKGITYDHKPSILPGFSLEINDKYCKNLNIFDPVYHPGDCTIHHSTSIHFASEVPKEAKRVVVVRIYLHATDEYVKDGHEVWYKKMIELNRKRNF